MGDSSTTTTDLDQTDEDILTYTVSDEALEVAAGAERGAPKAHRVPFTPTRLTIAADPRLRQRATDHFPRPMRGRLSWRLLFFVDQLQAAFD
jgi:hypothetical protein